MVRLAKEQAEALSRLFRSSPDFDVFLDLVRTLEAEAARACRVAEGVVLHRNQGRASALEDVLMLGDTAAKTLTGR